MNPIIKAASINASSAPRNGRRANPLRVDTVNGDEQIGRPAGIVQHLAHCRHIWMT
jgi:hypothetical protein